MIKLVPILLLLLLVSGCVNRHGISAKYYSECKEYYDYQGYYHKECTEDDIITYKELKEAKDAAIELFNGKKPEPKGNVW